MPRTGTDEEGRFSLFGMREGCEYTLRVRDEVETLTTVGPIRFDDKTREKELLIRLPAPVADLVLTGRIEDQEGRAVAMAAVRIGKVATLTGTDGRFRLVTRPGSDWLMFTAVGLPAGFLGDLGSLPSGEHDVGVLKLDAGGGVRVHGCVRDRLGDPLAEVEVSVGFGVPGIRVRGQGQDRPRWQLRRGRAAGAAVPGDHGDSSFRICRDLPGGPTRA